ncbi:MerR family transcriptional regulator [Actinomadura rudentiformis]|uniref:MerR family transcriptional regulator n=1 Tax=Actinomadura rudentiformis TaxID=359158 RepID=A0A6H9YDD8_9ACTN|nr:MerR family transcriptional regulator [Actinomadura rudentiformis]KAB2342198.1 MerR family transcriptional regulator [Actinomadura rudentiformis]
MAQASPLAGRAPGADDHPEPSEATPPPGRPGDLPIDDQRAPLYSIGQVASMLNLRQAFLRRLDEHHVVRPRRSAGGQRRYSRREIERIRQMVRLVDEGLGLSAVRRVLHLQQQMADVRRQLADLQRHDRHQGR